MTSSASEEQEHQPRPSDRIEIEQDFPESKIEAARASRDEGDAAVQTGDFELAARAYQNAIEADPRAIRAHHNLGVVRYRQQDWDSAISCFEQCLKWAPEDADLHFKLGLCHVKDERFQIARELFEQALRQNGDHLRSRFQLGLLYVREAGPGSKDRKRAVEELEAILSACDRGERFANLDRVCFLLGSFLDDEPEFRERAIEVYRRGLTVDPLFAPGHNNLGVLLLQDGQMLPALGAFKIAIQLEPDYGLPYGNLARLLFDHLSSEQMEREFANVIEDFGVQGPAVLARLSLELIDLGRGQVFESLYTHGHRLKNLMGIAGSRMRRLIRGFTENSEVLDDLKEIALEQEKIYTQWVAYLRSMKQDAMNLALVDVPQLVAKITETLSAQAGDIALDYASETEVPQIKADSGMLREAVANLTLNAIQAVDESDGQVTLQVGHDTERGSVYIEVEDNGSGIPESRQVRIFDPGFSTRKEGNGYGLSICSRIVSAHRGTLRIISRPGAGAVFRIDLPVDFELASEEESIRLQRSRVDASRDPVAEEFIP